jgi:hypothetical protein
MLQEEGSYSVEWRQYRQWSRTFWIVFLLYLPALALVSKVLGPIRGRGTVIFCAAAIWMLAFAISGYRKSNFQCPRCGEMFFRKFDDRPWRMAWQHNPFARKCMHCGLPKWAPAAVELS